MPHQAAQIQVIFVQSEPRVSHFVLAERLGVRRHTAVRQLIERNMAELKSYGMVSRRVTPITAGRGGQQNAAEYLLNEHQAILVCFASQTPQAAAVRKLVIETFVAIRRGKTVGAVAAPKQVTDGRIRHRKHQFAIAYAGLLDVGIDPETFDHSNVRAYARALLAAKDAF